MFKGIDFLTSSNLKWSNSKLVTVLSSVLELTFIAALLFLLASAGFPAVGHTQKM